MRASFSPICFAPDFNAFVSVAVCHCDEELIILLQYCTADRLAQQGSSVAEMGNLDLQRDLAACHDDGHPVRWCRKFVASALAQLLSRVVPARLCLEDQSMYSRDHLLHFQIPPRPTPRARSHPEPRSLGS